MAADAATKSTAPFPQTEAPVLVSKPSADVAVVTLNRARARNSLSLAMMDALHKAIDNLARDTDVKAIVLAADGPAFCAGHDLKEMSAHRSDEDGGEAFFEKTMAVCCDLMLSIVRCPKPVIGAIHATATAAGCQLVATCDLAVAADSAKFCTPGVNIGLFCSTPMVALSRNVPRKRAMEMLLLGDMVDAQTAADFGLVNRVVPSDNVMDSALALANQIASKSGATVRIGKAAFYAQADMSLDDAYGYAADIMVENMMKRDAEEGIAAFIEKRTPKWQDETP